MFEGITAEERKGEVVSEEKFEQRTPHLPCMVDDLLRCEHGWPVEIALCPKCLKSRVPPVHVGFMEYEQRVTGWTCPCGQDANHFEFCNSCQRPEP